jgi:hypothetical protein
MAYFVRYCVYENIHIKNSANINLLRCLEVGTLQLQPPDLSLACSEVLLTPPPGWHLSESSDELQYFCWHNFPKGSLSPVALE